MKKHEMKLDNESILKSINNDYIHRNKKLNKLMEIINSLDENAVIAIDGSWGSGKTVFVKQLLFLNKKENVEKLNKRTQINNSFVNEFQNKYICHYYNAWEYDFHTSPLLSLIYNIIESNPGFKKQTLNGKMKLPVNIFDFLQTATAGLFDRDYVKSYEDLYKEISSLEETKKSLNNLVDKIVPKNKKLLLVIDEIDRCKPSYAVDLLEIIKHFFDNDKIVFILSTNNKELSNVIKNYYGNDFDGYGYLNKFYDLIITLNEIAPTSYLSNVLKVEYSDCYYITVLFAVVDYFKLSMRQLNRIMSDFELLEKYFRTIHGGVHANNIMIKYIFLPYCLGLKLTSRNDLNDFINGTGLDKLLNYIDKIYVIKKIILEEYFKTKTASIEEINKKVISEYEKYFVINPANTMCQAFFDALSLLGGYSEITK